MKQAADMGRTIASLNPLKSLKKSPEFENVILKAIDIEFELRRSNLTDFYSRGYLASCVAEITFSEENINDLKLSGEIEESATLKMEVVSKNKKCSRTRIKEKDIDDYVKRKIP